MKVNKNVLEHLLSLPLPNNKKINLIELGCGDGSMLRHLKNKKIGSCLELTQVKSN